MPFKHIKENDTAFLKYLLRFPYLTRGVIREYFYPHYKSGAVLGKKLSLLKKEKYIEVVGGMDEKFRLTKEGWIFLDRYCYHIQPSRTENPYRRSLRSEGNRMTHVRLYSKRSRMVEHFHYRDLVYMVLEVARTGKVDTVEAMDYVEGKHACGYLNSNPDILLIKQDNKRQLTKIYVEIETSTINTKRVFRKLAHFYKDFERDINVPMERIWSGASKKVRSGCFILCETESLMLKYIRVLREFTEMSRNEKPSTISYYKKYHLKFEKEFGIKMYHFEVMLRWGMFFFGNYESDIRTFLKEGTVYTFDNREFYPRDDFHRFKVPYKRKEINVNNLIMYDTE